MPTIVSYTTADAIYGTGAYGSASYGVVNGGVILDSLTLTSTANSLFETTVEITPGIEATTSLGTLTFITENIISVGSVVGTLSVGSPTSSGVIFDYEAVKEEYDRRRTVYINRAA